MTGASPSGDGTEAYRGMAIPGFPNWFTVCGIKGVVSYAPYFADFVLTGPSV